MSHPFTLPRLGAALLVTLSALSGLLTTPAAQAQDSRLYQVTKSGVVRVCQYTSYYSISYRDPASGEIVGLDADLAQELAKELGVELQIVETNFATFIADLQADKCEIGMFGVGATLKRAQAVAFSDPYLVTSIYGVAKKGGPISQWSDIDQEGHVVVVSLGSYVQTVMEALLDEATVKPIAPPATREGEVVTGNADIMMTDWPTVLKLQENFDWVQVIEPEEVVGLTPYAYVVPHGDPIWLGWVNLFVDTIKRDGRLAQYAAKHNLGPIVAP
ncbi:MAG: ABC transporter substrate-binding protein [Candidatus Competibacterales bacterium]